MRGRVRTRNMYKIQRREEQEARYYKSTEDCEVQPFEPDGQSKPHLVHQYRCARVCSPYEIMVSGGLLVHSRVEVLLASELLPRIERETRLPNTPPCG